MTCGFENDKSNFVNFNQRARKYQNWDIYGTLLSKVNNILAESLQRSFVSLQWRVMHNLEKNWLVVSKLTWEIWLILTQALKSLKNSNFSGLFLTKVYNVWYKKVQRIYVW